MDALKEARALLEHGRHASEWTLRQHLAALVAELEAARAVVEYVRETRGVCMWRARDAAVCRCPDCRASRLLDNYDAAKAGKAVE